MDVPVVLDVGLPLAIKKTSLTYSHRQPLALSLSRFPFHARPSFLPLTQPLLLSDCKGMVSFFLSLFFV